jgi:hypothetical protein
MGRQRAKRLYPSDLTDEEHVWSATARLRAEVLILWLPFKVLPRAEATHTRRLSKALVRHRRVFNAHDRVLQSPGVMYVHNRQRHVP